MACTRKRRSLPEDATIQQKAKRQREVAGEDDISSKPIYLEVQPFDYKTTPISGGLDGSLDCMVIRCWCKTADGKVNLLKFRGFPCTAYVELPRVSEDGLTLGWNMMQISALKEFMLEDSLFRLCRPTAVELVKKKKLYYADTAALKFARLRFRNEAEMGAFCKIIRNKHVVECMGSVRFDVHEDNVKTLSKFLARVNCKCTQWMGVECKEVPQEDRICRDGIGEYEAMYETVVPLDKVCTVGYKVLSFDIEVYSSVETRFPVALFPKDEVFAISVVTQNVHPGEMESERKRWCICRGPADVLSPGEVGDEDSQTFAYKVIDCSSEMEIINRFASLVVSEDPDIVTGHNIWGFDMKYLFIRSVLMNSSSLPNMSRLKTSCSTQLESTFRMPESKQTLDNRSFVLHNLEENTEGGEIVYPEEGSDAISPGKSGNRKLGIEDGKLVLVPISSSSEAPCSGSPHGTHGHSKKRLNAYSRNKNHSFVIEGRVSLDTLVACKDRKLDTYGLQNVCNTLMGKSKLDISPKDIFKAFRVCVLGEPTDEDIIALGGVEGGEGFDASNSFDKMARNLMNKVIYYCVKDSDLVVDLFMHLSTWLTCMEYAKCFGVTPYDSLACGQQSRCLSIIYIIATNRGFVLDHPSSLDQGEVNGFVGGRVVDPVPGIYDFVMCFDFNSLYPSIIQEMNICHTTFIPQARWGEFSKGDYISIKEKEEDGDMEFRYSTKTRGIIPELCDYLVKERCKAKIAMAGAAPGSAERVTMNCRQRALKMTANSMYGLMGSEVSSLQLLQGSRSITCRGRELQIQLATALEKEFDVVEVYGDTDSSMLTGRGNLNNDIGHNAKGGLEIKSAREGFALAKRMEEFLNGNESGTEKVFRYPIRVEMEKLMKMMLVHKKMYGYLEYKKDSAGNDESFVTSSTGEPLLQSKGLISARRGSSRICKRTFDTILKMLLENITGEELLLKVSSLIREFLISEDVDDFVRTVEIAGSYASKSCVNNVFKENMLKMGTKIDPKSRVSYVVVVTKREKMNNVSSPMGEKMLLTKYYDPTLHVIDTLKYLESGLKTSVDQIVPLGAVDYNVKVQVPGIGYVCLNKPVSVAVKLVACKGRTWDVSKLDIYNRMVVAHSAKLRKSS